MDTAIQQSRTPRWLSTLGYIALMIVPIAGLYTVWRAYFHETTAPVWLRWTDFGLFVFGLLLVHIPSTVGLGALLSLAHLVLFISLVYRTTAD